MTWQPGPQLPNIRPPWIGFTLEFEGLRGRLAATAAPAPGPTVRQKAGAAHGSEFDTDGLAGLDLRTAAQFVPALQVLDPDLVLAGDAPQRVAALHDVLDSAAGALAAAGRRGCRTR